MMGAALRIERDDVVAMADELARLRGVSVSDAVADSLLGSLERERHRADKVRRIVELGREIRVHLAEPDAVDDEWLYDANGLPA